ncbi:MAG: hypothetical protein K2N15_10870 [Lachnospiraceae bacterium]|nr:hypothetical protein [Lachnospiraceae bacterium]
MKIIKFMPIFVVSAIILFLISCPIINDISAKGIIKDITALPLPEKTDVVEEFSQARKLIGCGNGMQFFGAILIKSDLPLEEIDRHYSAYRDVEWEYIVKEQETQDIDVIEHGAFSFDTDVSAGEYFIVYSWGDGMSPFRDFDLRGN